MWIVSWIVYTREGSPRVEQFVMTGAVAVSIRISAYLRVTDKIALTAPNVFGALDEGECTILPRDSYFYRITEKVKWRFSV